MSPEKIIEATDRFYEVHMLRMRIVAFIIGFAAATLVMVSVTRAEGSAPPLLKEKIVVDRTVVTLGDLFDNAGAVSDRPVFRSPDIGDVGAISAARVKSAAARHGLNWPNYGGVSTITVIRDSRRVDVEEQKEMIRKALSTRTGIYNPDTLQISFDEEMSPIHLSPSSKDRLVVKSLRHNKRSGYFRAVLSVEGARTTLKDHVVRGQAIETALLHVPVKNILPGDVVAEDDLKVQRLPLSRVQKRYVKSLDDIVGKAVKRRLLAGRPILFSSLEEPKMVRKSALVDVLFERQGLSLKVEGRALQDGALGETVKVTNTHSRRTIVGTVVGPGQVSVTGSTRRPQAQTQPKAQTQTRQFSYNQASRPVIANGWEPVRRVR